MKRNFDLLRSILLLVEKKNTLDDVLDWPELIEENYDAPEIHYHLLLLKDVNYIVLKVEESNTSTYYDLIRMTMQGHNYLDSVRDPKIWKDTKNSLSKVGGAATLEIVQAVSIAMVKTSLAKVGVNI